MPVRSREIVDPLAVRHTLECVEGAVDSVWGVLQLASFGGELSGRASGAAVAEIREVYRRLEELRCRLGFNDEVELGREEGDQ